jgi:DNA-directed RNA polymerase beta' subunit
MATVPYSEISSIGLYILGTEDNIHDAHVNVIYQDLTRNNLPYPNGINDAHMGTTSNEWECDTCHHDKRLCPGHPGVINLNYPVPSPMFLKDIMKWLKIICFNCGKVVIPYRHLRFREDRILGEYVKTIRTNNKNVPCVHCGAIHPNIVKEKTDPISVYMEFYDIRTTSAAKGQLLEKLPLYPHQMQAIFNKITDETVMQMGKPLECHPRKLVINALRVPENTIRPDIKKIGGGRSNNNDLTVLLQTIVKINDQIPASVPIDMDSSKIDEDMKIQVHNLCLTVYDLIKGSNSTAKRGIVNNSKKPLTSIAKRLPRKFGRIRRNLMGRRANYMGRSFITGDPFLRIDEVGVPLSIARDIQKPEIVREYNYKEMMTYFMNGNKRYPGCSKVKRAATGATHWVERIKGDFRLEIGDTIYRDIITGDRVNFNRQPSLEPSSISSMRVVVMEKGDTIRMNVLSCPLFNADFDGDAMNLLFTRSNRTANEIHELASPAQFFISYKNGSPQLGANQDALIGIAKFTAGTTKLDKFHAMQMFSQIKVYHDFSKYPADKIFSGRELVSILFKETKNFINYTGTASIYKEEHAPYRRYDPSDVKVEIDRGELKSGVLDKKSVGNEGAAPGGVFHIIHNQYGPEAALEATYYIQQLALSYIFNHGITVSVGDILLREEALEEIHKIEATLISESLQITEKLNQGKIIPPIGKTITTYYEEQQINALNPGDAYWPHILGSIDPDNNNLYSMISVGSRGNLKNFKNISSALGQLEINGERMKENFGGRALPYFTKYDFDPASRGHIGNSYISGLNPTEFFFHAQEARYALINKALSTSITGMQNRMSIKNLEAMLIDNQRRAVNGHKVVQLIYGGDGADPRFIERVKFPTMAKNLSDADFDKKFHAHTDQFAKEFQNKNVQKLLDEEYAKLLADRQFYRTLFLNLETISGKMYSDTAVLPVNINRIIEDTIYNLELKKYNADKPLLNPVTTIEKVKKLCDGIVYCLLNEIQERKQAPVPEYLRSSTTLLQILIRSYLNCASLRARGMTDEALDLVIRQIRMTYEKSLISYGKAVGIIAAQSISEPMTQMVLDSHHHSGSSSTKKKGMFRIKEILGARSTENMKAPSMTLNVLPEYRKNKIKVQEIANHIEMMPLKRFLKGWQIFFEKYGQPIHPQYKHEKDLIKEFEKYNPHVKVPSDLTNWCLRIALDKFKMIEKQMRIDSIYHRIRQNFPYTHVVYSTDNADTVVLRIYVRNIVAKKAQITTAQMSELMSDILNMVVRGVRGINAAYVKEVSVSTVGEDGAVRDDKVYNIFTDGTNMEEILENPYIDPNTVQSDSVMETYELFGVEAARTKIINELKHQVEGSSHRHYTIYADEMTFNGAVTSIDRFGSAKRDASIMLRISDASPIAVIEESALNAVTDNLTGVSPPIMVGKNPQIGDLYNHFQLDEEMVAEKIKNLDDMLKEL